MKNYLVVSAMTAFTCLTASVVTMAQTPPAAQTAEQKELGKRLPQTVVVRISNSTGIAEVMESKTALKDDPSTIAAVEAQTFKPVDVNLATASGGELDGYVSRDSSYRGWGRGWGRGNWGYGGGGWGGYGGYNYGNGWGGGYNNYGYNPFYSYYGYNYYYQPYYSYYNPGYTYYYYGCY